MSRQSQSLLEPIWSPSWSKRPLNGHEKYGGNGAGLGMAGRAAVPLGFPGSINALCVGEARASLDLGGKGERGGRGRVGGRLLTAPGAVPQR